MNGIIDHKKKIANRYKTEICKNWVAGFCEYGEKCAFAHGNEEIRGKSFYKTKKCKQFFENGFCMFGNKCLFQHLSTLAESFDNENIDCLPNNEESLNNKPRLRVFQQISQNWQD